ncbi:MAG: hypothetical protein QXG86_01230 [Candidatus Woesearchaeota archaeon]
METPKSLIKKVATAKKIKELTKEIKINSAYTQLLTEVFWPHIAAVFEKYNNKNDQKVALLGFVKGFEASLRRNHNQDNYYSGYSQQEMKLCVEVAVNKPEHLDSIIKLMEEKTLSNSEVYTLAKNLGIEEYLINHMKNEKNYFC